MQKGETDVTAFSAEILNAALAMSLEWGENWLKNINERIRAAYPQLTSEDAEILNRWCAEVRSFAYKVIEVEYHTPPEKLIEPAMPQIKSRYPQLNQENLNHLYSQGMYYAWHG